MYFLITTSEDGDVSISATDKETLLKMLTPDSDGYAEITPEQVRTDVENFKWFDLQQKAGTFIIKGELIVPKAVETVTTFEVL